jgi:hypothetical protein
MILKHSFIFVIEKLDDSNRARYRKKGENK